MVEASSLKMRELVFGLPEQLAEARAIADKVDYGRGGGFGRVVAAGMGGSGISAYLIHCLLADRVPTPIIPWHDYSIPAAADRGSLFFAVSYSGNTEETLTAFRQALRRKCHVIAVTSGGRLAELAERARLPLAVVPGGLPPRAALGYLFVALLAGLERLRICRSHRADLSEAVKQMAARRRVWFRRAGIVASGLQERLPLVYSTCRLLDAVAERWRCQLNENAKVMCHVNVFPEHNHNEVVGMGAPDFIASRSALVALLDSSTGARVRMRLKNVLGVTRGRIREGDAA